jgi:DNA polymerase-3 subunit delta
MTDVLDDLAHGRVAPVYVAYGSEPGPMRALVEAVRKAAVDPGFEAFNHERFVGRDLDAPKPVLEACAQLPMMSKRRLVEIDEPEAIGRGKGGGVEALVDYLAAPNPTTVLLVTSTGIDGRSRLVTAAKKLGVVLKCEPLKRDDDARAFVREEAKRRRIAIAADGAAALVELVGTSPGALADALASAALWAGEGAQVGREAVLAVVVRTREAVVFELTDAVGMGRRERALAVLAELMADAEGGEIGQVNALLAMLIRQIRLVATALAVGGRPAAIEAALGLPPFVARKLADQARVFDEARLRRALAGLARLDADLKGGSYAAARAPVAALQRWILDVCGGLPGVDARV